MANPGDSVFATPQGRYQANPLHRFFLGDGNRDLWSTPIEVEVLDLDTFAGGLIPVRLGGGLQTRSLRLQGADGVLYNFRALDKDASRTLDPELRRSIAARVLQDQIGALLPLSALVVAPILESADVLHADPMLVVMPTDPRLGEFQEEFAGLLGFIEERPDEGPDGSPGFAGSSRVTGSERFLELLEERPQYRVDDRAYLRARLMDLFVGDWDRHPDQWRWAAFAYGDITRFEPIPRDRDWALSRLNGLLVWAASFGWPHYKGFEADYASVFNVTWSGRALDRRLLSGTARETWDETALDLQERLTDHVIEDAVARLPDSYYALTGPYLVHALKSRRDELRRYAEEFYLLLAGEVDIHATDESDQAIVEHQTGGLTDVQLFALLESGEPATEPYFRRVFDESETEEVRIYLHGDDDRAIIQGESTAAIRVRVVGGGSDDTLEDRTSGLNTSFYDDRGDNHFLLAADTRVDESEYEQPEDRGSATHQALPRDWGSRTIPVPYVSYDPDVGMFIGAGFIRYQYGFRHFPYQTRLAASLGFGSSASRLRTSVDFQFPLSGQALMARLRGRWSGAEANNFYGLGNSTPANAPRDFFLAERRQLDLEALVELRLTEKATLAVGPVLSMLRPYPSQGTFIESEKPYGDGNFDEVGIVGRLGWDGRNRAIAATSGASAFIEGRFLPGILDVGEGFGGLRGEAAVYLSTESFMEPTLAIRVSGERLWGEYPYFEAAYLGGASSLRGFQNQRFAGDAAVFVNAELRVFLTNISLLLPGELGVFSLTDAGRVYLDGEFSRKLHSAVGGGIWVAFLDRAYTMSFALARGDEETGIYAKAGFLF